jgi:glycosyltransferase involved in cell wall biosynthesis
MIGPFPEPITGESFINEKIFRDFSKYFSVKLDLINTSTHDFGHGVGRFSMKKFIYNLIKYPLAYKILFSDVIYLTPGQTFLGTLRFLPYILISRILQKKVVVHVQANKLSSEYMKLPYLIKLIFSYVYNLADVGIVLSPSLRNNLEVMNFKGKIVCLNNFIGNYLTNLDLRKKSKHGLKIVYLGNLLKEKGILDLLQALRILNEKGYEFKAVIAGNVDNRIRGQFFSFIDNLKSNVKYVGVVKGKTKKELLLNSNVFVLPSFLEHEAQPVSILEAMASGNIIITTNQGGIPDVIKDGRNGFFVKKQNPEDLASKLIFVGDNLSKFRKMINSNYKGVNKNYSEEKFFRDFYDIIKALCLM